MDRNLLIQTPAGVYSVYKDPQLNWNYETEQETELDHRTISLPRGKVLGGSSSINSMVYMRGHPQDYDHWAKKHNLPKWTFDQCLPYFKKCESSDRGASDWRGAEGGLGVSQAKLDNLLFDAFIEAGKQAGQGTTDDPNGKKPEGVCRLDSTTKNGRRSSAAAAHLKPALSRPNLHLLVKAHVLRLILTNGCATGVEIEHRGKRNTIQTAKEILVCAGAINSPQLLMLSGIGSDQQLKSHGISLVHHLPGVGQNRQDHLSISVVYESLKPVTYHNLSNPLRKLVIGTQWLLTGKGLAASNIWEAGGYIRGYTKVEYPNLQYHFAPFYATYEGTRIRLFNGYTTQLDQLRPRSKGEIRLRSANPKDHPAACFHYLSSPFDVCEMIEAVKRTRELHAQKAFNSFRGREIEPGPDVVTDTEIESFIRKTTTTDYHPCGTCKMGIDDMPDVVSGNLNAPIQMMALKAADFVLGRKPLPPFKASFEFRPAK